MNLPLGVCGALSRFELQVSGVKSCNLLYTVSKHRFFKLKCLLQTLVLLELLAHTSRASTLILTILFRCRSSDFTDAPEQTINDLVCYTLVNHKALKVGVLMRVGAQQKLSDFFLCEGVLLGNLDHKSTHLADMGALEKFLCIRLQLVQISFL